MQLFITGVTGFLGGEVLVNLAARKEIEKIYCLVRIKDGEADPKARLRKIFELHNDHYDANKIELIEGNLTDEDLVIKLKADPRLKNIDHVIHSAANTSFSGIYNDLIDKVNIQGLKSLLTWAESLEVMNKFVYIGTATICGKDVLHRMVHEDESPNLQASHLVRYTYSKMMGELMVREMLPKEKILILRPSIIMGDSRPVFPRSPVILWTLATANLIRLLPIAPDSALDVIPVDYAAKAITALLFAKRRFDTYHISAGTPSVSTPFKLAKAIEAFYPERPAFKFIDQKMLNPIKIWSKKGEDKNNHLADFTEYTSYWSSVFNENGQLRILLAGMEPYFGFLSLGQTFNNDRLLADTTIGAPPPAHQYILSSRSYLDKINILEAALDP